MATVVPKKNNFEERKWKNRGICYDHTRFGYDFLLWLLKTSCQSCTMTTVVPQKIILKSATWETALRNRNDFIILIYIYISYTPGGQPKCFSKLGIGTVSLSTVETTFSLYRIYEKYRNIKIVISEIRYKYRSHS